VPAHLVVEEHRRHVYKCSSCCKANAAGDDVSAQIVRAPMPTLSPIPHSFATASMLSYVINAKYANSMPYYRLEEDFRSIGADISRQDMANWTINVYERWLSLIHARMKEKLLECKYLNADETEVQVLKEPDRLPTQKSYMWLFRSGPYKTPNCIFEYHPTRSGNVVRTFLKDWSGYLTTDGYDPYFNLGIEGVINTACLVHIRRKFAEIVKVTGGDAACEGINSFALEARRRIDHIFHIDKKFDDMEPEARKKARIEKLKPHMESFKVWAEDALDKAVPKMPLHDALLYSLKYWPYVMNVLKDGHLGLDNNIAERAIKSFVIGRNYVHAKAMC
ncbi:IS66 family transposase, partial [Adlercreutzia sp. ZJ141]|uniref:IS66 family transposase n=1 Tax=Adlercreutzia sp. ZJ141 TaxID=2709406 RepID=UPI0013ED9019